MDFIDFYATLKEISYMLNSRPVELLLNAYSKSGGAHSSLPDSWTAITPNDLLIGDGRTGSLKSNYTETGPARLAKIENKVSQWHQAWVEACQDTLFRRDPRWVKKTRNIEVGDIVWLVQDSKLCRRLKWAIVKSVHPDHDGVVRDAIVRYALLKPGPEPYIAGFNKKGPSKQNWWLFRTYLWCT